MGKDKWDITHLCQVCTTGGITCAIIGTTQIVKCFCMCPLRVLVLHRYLSHMPLTPLLSLLVRVFLEARDICQKALRDLYMGKIKTIQE